MNTYLSSTPAKPLDIAIAGETNLDLILHGLPQEMPTERELLGSGFNLTLGGSSSILAHNLSALGARVGFASQVGSDEMGDIAIARLAEAGIDTSHIARKPGAGDSFNADFLRAWLNGDHPLRAAAFANFTGALSTLRSGGTEAYRDAPSAPPFSSNTLRTIQPHALIPDPKP
jgi:sugar/nucleoside kinase (ribokinase family)